MEQFEYNDEVKEKSVFLLHLDTARIILISAIVIGVITASFLFGMNYVDKKGNKNDLSMMDNSFGMSMNDSNKIQDNKKIPDSLDISNNNNDDVKKPGNENLLKDTDNKLTDNSPTKKSSKNNLDILKDDSLNKDLLSKEKIREVIPRDSNGKSKNRYARHNLKKKTKYSKRNKRRDRIKKRRRYKKRKNSQVVEVSYKTRRYNKTRLPRHYYAIQIASYDKRYKARKEMRRLKRMSFKSFVDRKVVHGKRYYRVRIGPLSSKRRALKLMADVQNIKKYENSYMIRK